MSFPSTFALFVISVASSSTITSNVTGTFVLPFTSTLIPFSRFCSVYEVSSLSTFTLPSTRCVPSGILSFTKTRFAKSPSFETVTVYVIVSPSITYGKSFCVCNSFLAEIIDSIYVCVTSFVGILSINA